MTNPTVETSTPSVMDNIIEKTAEKTSDYLIDKAKEQLNKILFETKKVKDAQSRLKLVMERYNLQKSTFSTISDWYYERPFWQKFTVIAIIIGVAIVAGVFIHAVVSALLAVAALGLCLAAHIILTEHSENTANCNEKLCEDLEELEQKLAGRLKTLGVLEDKIKRILSSLASTNIQLAEDELKLRFELSGLESAVAGLKTTHGDIESITEDLINMQGGLISRLSSAQATIQSLESKMEVATTNISHTNQALVKTEKAISNEVADIKHINEGLEQSFQNFNRMMDSLESQILPSSQNSELDDAIKNANKLMEEINIYYSEETQHPDKRMHQGTILEPIGIDQPKKRL